MALYVQSVPNPGVGRDWRATVPGQYLWNVTGITATLTLVDTTSVMADSSGNGLHGRYHYSTPGISEVPGVVAGVTSALMETPAGVSLGTSGQSPNAMPRPGGVNPRSIEVWAIGLPISGTTMELVGSVAPDFLGRILVALDGTIQFDSGAATGPATLSSPVGTFVNDANPHHIVGTADAAGMTLYYDGVAVAAVAAARTGTGNLLGIQIGNLVPGPFASRAHVVGQVACYPSVLSGARVAAHFAAAAVSGAAYSAAVLADAPRCYYKMDDALGRGLVTPTLVVTDSANEVLRIPPAQQLSVAGSVLFSWQPGLNSSDAIPTGEVVTVAVPSLILPPGYTVGTETPDLSTTSRWTNVKVWWDSNVMDAQIGTSPYVYAPSIHLVYTPERGF